METADVKQGHLGNGGTSDSMDHRIGRDKGQVARHEEIGDPCSAINQVEAYR